MLQPIALPAIPENQNYIWLLTDASRHALIVDPGAASPVIDALERTSLTPTGILLTHHHWDHIDGVEELVARFPGTPVIAPAHPKIPFATRRVADGDRVSFDRPGADFEVIAVPGHTHCHVAYYGAGILLSGDALFSVGCGRLFEGTPGQMLTSLQRLAALPPETLLCCGHEYTVANCAFALSVEPSNTALQRRYAEAKAARAQNRPTVPVALADELAVNPFLRLDAAEIRAAALAALAPTGESSPVARLAWLRAKKDHFRP